MYEYNPREVFAEVKCNTKFEKECRGKQVDCDKCYTEYLEEQNKLMLEELTLLQETHEDVFHNNRTKQLIESIIGKKIEALRSKQRSITNVQCVNCDLERLDGGCNECIYNFEQLLQKYSVDKNHA